MSARSTSTSGPMGGPPGHAHVPQVRASSTSGGGALFLYNVRVALAIVPAFALTLGFAGKMITGLLMVGGMTAYVLESARAPAASLGVAWAFLATANAAQWFTAPSHVASSTAAPTVPSLINVAQQLLVSLLHLMVGAWFTLQFKFIPVRYPAIAQACEHVLFGLCPLVCAAVLTWGAMLATGAAAAPFVYLCMSSVFYLAFGTPQPSSFQRAGRVAIGGGNKLGFRGDATGLASTRAGAAAAAFAYAVLPAALQLAIHLGPILRLDTTEICSLLLLGTAPMVVLALSAPYGSLWWLGLEGFSLDVLRHTALLVGLIGLVAGFEGRVVFASFGQYIHVPSPWSYLLVTPALYAGAALFASHFTGALGGTVDLTVAGMLAVGAAGAGAFAMGVPLPVMPAPLVAAAGFALYYESGLLRDYLLFALGALLFMVWFVQHNFWFVDLDVGGRPVHHICRDVLVSTALVLLACGVSACRVDAHAVGAAFVASGTFFTHLEAGLYRLSWASAGHGEVVYPAWLVAVTSFAGVAAVRALSGGGRLPGWAAWALQCTMAGKVAVLVAPETSLYVAVTVLVVAATLPSMLLAARAKVKAEMGASSGMVGAALSAHARQAQRMSAPQAWAHATICWAIVAWNRFAFFEALQVIFGRRPSDALLIGCLLGLAGGSILPAAARHLPTHSTLRRLGLLMCAGGVLMVILAPPLPMQGMAYCPHFLPMHLCPRLWDEAHVPFHAHDDPAIYGMGAAGAREHWARWLLVMPLASSLVGASGLLPASRSGVSKGFLTVASGAAIGWYAALELLPGYGFILHSLVGGSCAAAAAFCVFLLARGPASPAASPILALLIMVVFVSIPAAFALVTYFPPEALDAVRENVLRKSGMDSASEARSSLLVVNACVMAALALAIKLRQSRESSRDDRGPGIKSHGMAYPRQSSDATLRRIGLAWLPTMCNACATLAFVFGLCYAEADGGEAVSVPGFLLHRDGAALCLAPLFLLLCSDSMLLQRFAHRQRYAPPVAVAAASLALSAARQVAAGRYAAERHIAVHGDGVDFVWTLRNALCLLCALPSLALFVRFLWERGVLGDTALLLATPLNAAPLLFSDLSTTRALAVLGVACACVQYIAAGAVRRTGLKLI